MNVHIVTSFRRLSRYILFATLLATAAFQAEARPVLPIFYDTNGHLRYRTGKPLTCDHIASRDGHDTSGRSWTSHPWFKDKPWLGKILARSNRPSPDEHKEALEEKQTKRARPDHGPWFKDKPWLGRILSRSTQSAPNKHYEGAESERDAHRPAQDYPSWFKDGPWLGEILLGND